MVNDTLNFKLSEFLCHHCGLGTDVVTQGLLTSLQQWRDVLAKPMLIDDGYRCAVHNAAVGGAPNSAHLFGQAADVADPDGSLVVWVLANLPMLAALGFYFEDFRWTPRWVHAQTCKPASEHRIFIPSSMPAPAPGRWSGVYDHALDY